MAAALLATAGCNAILGNDRHNLAPAGNDGGIAGAGGAAGTGAGGAAGAGGVGGAAGAAGSGGAGGGAACGARGQPCCSGSCDLRASCDGTACIAADVWSATADGTYHFNGGTWNQPLLSGSTAPLPSVTAMWGTSATFVVGAGSGFMLRNDGLGWHKDSIAGVSVGMGTLSAVSGANATDVWAVGDTYFAHWNGSSWASVTLPQAVVPYYAVWISGPGEGWAVGEEGTMAQLSGGTWTDRGHSSNGYAYYGIWGSAATDVYAVGQRHTLSGTPLYIRHYGNATACDGGPCWSDLTPMADPSGTMLPMHAVWGSDASHVWVVGEGGQVLFWNGSVWTAPLTGAGSSETLLAVWGSGPRDVWVAGSAGARHYNGTMWSPVPGLGAATTIWLSAN